MPYEEALFVLEQWEGSGDTARLQQEVQNAIYAARRALNDCLEMGLNGEGGD